MKITLVITVISFILLGGCGGQNSGSQQQDNQAQSTGESGLSEFEMNHGIGPVNEPIALDDEINSELASTGEEIFKTKCSACHKMSERYVGPPLGDVLDQRTPAYVMNMILNPVEMTKKHPEAKKMLAQYMNQMTFQNVSREEARAIVEYLRTADES